MRVFVSYALNLSSVLLEACKRSARKRSSVHNASVWPLSPDLTIKVFSMLDTRSVFCAAATCSFFQKCAIDPLCYINIELGTLESKIKPNKDPKTKDAMVSTIIQRAGSAIHCLPFSLRLRSIKLDIKWPYISEADDDEQWEYMEGPPFLTGCCLSSLCANGGVAGSCLRSLQLYRIGMKDKETLSEALSASLSVCHSLVQLKIVDMECSYQSYNGVRPPDMLETSVCKEFVVNCPKITTLAVQTCILFPCVAFELVKGFNELKYVDFTNCFSLTGAFLEDLATEGGGNSLEVMILKGLYSLDKVGVEKFMEALVAGKCRQLRHLDISKSGGLVRTRDDSPSRFGVSCIIPSNKLLKQRPNFCLVNKIY
ncbi:hypothetical protein Lser_V15G31675 [Lactuca serriola]